MLLVPLLAAVAACGSPAPSGTPSATSSNTATPSGSAAPTATPAATPALQECTASQLEGEMDTQQGAAGTIYAGFEVRDTASVACTMQGYFGVQMTSGGGQMLALTYAPTTGNGVSPTLVTLQPNTAPLNSGNDVGHAIFYMRWTDTCNTPETPANFLFTPPQLNGSFAVPAHLASQNTPPEVCGHVDIGPISPRGTQQPF
jgi:hypothetical protein